jgi:large subunit ribosomal protein L21
MEYAVVKTGGKQYKATKGAVIAVDNLGIKEGKETMLGDVMLVVSDGKVQIGKPMVKNAKVKAKILEETRGDKIKVSKFKAKARYRRVMGFRPTYTRLQIEEVVFAK